MIDFNDYELRISDIYLDSQDEKCVSFDFVEKENTANYRKQTAFFSVQLDGVMVPICYYNTDNIVARSFKDLFVAKSNLEIAEMFGQELEWKRIERKYNEN